MLSKDLTQTKKREEEGNEKKEIKGMKLTLTPFNVVFGFDENPKLEYKCHNPRHIRRNCKKL